MLRKFNLWLEEKAREDTDKMRADAEWHKQRHDENVRQRVAFEKTRIRSDPYAEALVWALRNGYTLRDAVEELKPVAKAMDEIRANERSRGIFGLGL